MTTPRRIKPYFKLDEKEYQELKQASKTLKGKILMATADIKLLRILD